ncbi:hypothetical protein [Kutzneria kofuensis]|uniref:hypothetical protein n=1 Tax=Kutzneria kofuensis TaxID=103725 RepID=UPI0031EAB4FA
MRTPSTGGPAVIAILRSMMIVSCGSGVRQIRTPTPTPTSSVNSAAYAVSANTSGL